MFIHLCTISSTPFAKNLKRSKQFLIRALFRIRKTRRTRQTTNRTLGNSFSAAEALRKPERQCETMRHSINSDTDPEMQALAMEESKRDSFAAQKPFEASCAENLLPKDPRNARDVIAGNRAGAAAMNPRLCRKSFFACMPPRRTNRMGNFSIPMKPVWAVSRKSFSRSAEGGPEVYKSMKYESGVHRVQRIPRPRNRDAFTLNRHRRILA